MRLVIGLGFAFLAATPAFADTVTEVVQYNNVQVQNGPVSLSGQLFNPALGTLTGVSLRFSGGFQGDIYAEGSNLPAQITANLFGTVFEPGESQMASLGSFTMNQTSPDIYMGGTSYNFSETLSDIASYIGTSANDTDYLASLGLYARTPPLGASDDFSTYFGSMQVTYTYTVPEPASLALLATATTLFAGLCFFRRKPDAQC